MLTNKIQSRAGLGGSAISSLLLVIIPKCPICLAAYSTLFTAIGVNASILYGIRIALSVIMLVSVFWLVLRVIRQKNFLPALGLILGTGFVLLSWITETPTVYNIGAVMFLAIMAFWAARFRYQRSSIGEVRSCEQC